MSAVRFVFPKPRLAKLLKMPGGLPVAEALERAQANLDTIRPTCMAELQALLELTEARLEAMGESFDDEGMADLYAIAVRGIGGGEVCHVPAVDLALTSLCDLLDHLRTGQRYDRAAIVVHVRAWRMLLGMGDQPGTAAVVDGLRQVSSRYAA
ncbi:hypothetical protein [Phenylobacterium sp. J367]|uniref:hypothetical protein n=1 Tax=Phenylobacterium sp. J367 TaxID=2898435 RepID=UPI0021510382|nr:hypothetical protein [Phenylobacterium sp. J367]MCR5878187.1 hypothetical protein [Phenylobacterium sp. J367]